MKAEDKLDLRGGRSIWDSSIERRRQRNALTESIRTRILIIGIGGGITGSFLAERLSRLTSSIIVLDRHQPQAASTAASTSLLQWELDTSLSELPRELDPEKARAIYHASALAVRTIVALSGELGIDSRCVPRPSLLNCFAVDRG